MSSTETPCIPVSYFRAWVAPWNHWLKLGIWRLSKPLDCISLWMLTQQWLGSFFPPHGTCWVLCHKETLFFPKDFSLFWRRIYRSDSGLTKKFYILTPGQEFETISFLSFCLRISKYFSFQIGSLFSLCFMIFNCKVLDSKWSFWRDSSVNFQ